ncbi:MAG: hypothetical protein ACTHKE_03305 [Sphingomicrobium sp.]
MAQEFVIRIRADDAATATVKKIQAALGKVTEPIEKVEKRVGKLGDLSKTNLGKIEKGFRTAATSASKLVDKIVEIVPGLTAIGGAASLAGLSALAVRFGSFGFTLNKTSKLLGMNAQDLAAWHVAARRAGVSAEEFDSAMNSSQMAIRGAANGADPHAMLLLQKMGVQIARNKDGTVDYYSTQMRLMKAIQGQHSVQAQREAAGTFGMGGLLPMIQRGTWDADKARAYRQGLVPTDAEIAQAKAFNEDISDLRASAEGLGNTIGSSLIPVLDPLVKGISHWLDQNRAMIADKLAAAVQKFVEWISKINWDDVAEKAKTLWDNLGGVKGVLLAIAALKFAGPIAGLASMAFNLGKIASFATNPFVAAITGGMIAEYSRQKAFDSAIPAGPDHDQQVAEAMAGGVVAPNVAQPPAGGWGKIGQLINRWTASGKTAPLGIRSNNPLNILDHNQERVYASPEEGIQAAAENLRRGYRGLTLAQIADKWTGGARTGNSPQQIANYVGLLAQGTGLHADQVPDLDNQSVVAGLLKAQIRAENGQQPYSDEQVNAGVAAGMPATPGAHSARVAQMQQAALHITFDNVPSGVRPEAKTQDGSYLPTKVNYRLDGI